MLPRRAPRACAKPVRRIGVRRVLGGAGCSHRENRDGPLWSGRRGGEQRWPDDLQVLTVTHIFLLWAKDLISLADPAALGGRARERTCSMKAVIGPRPSSGRPTLGMPDAPTVS